MLNSAENSEGKQIWVHFLVKVQVLSKMMTSLEIEITFLFFKVTTIYISLFRRWL